MWMSAPPLFLFAKPQTSIEERYRCFATILNKYDSHDRDLEAKGQQTGFQAAARPARRPHGNLKGQSSLGKTASFRWTLDTIRCSDGSIHRDRGVPSAFSITILKVSAGHAGGWLPLKELERTGAIPVVSSPGPSRGNGLSIGVSILPCLRPA